MVDRLDVVRVFVDVPEQDANYVQIGTKASVLASVQREVDSGHGNSHLLGVNVKSRTLRAEIDLKNPESRLLPGMYAYANVIIERPGVKALPTATLVHSGDQIFYWSEKSNQAVGPRSRRASAMASGPRSPTAAPVLESGLHRRCRVGADRRLGAGHRRRRRSSPRAPRCGLPRSRAGQRSRVQLLDGGSENPAWPLFQRGRAAMMLQPYRTIASPLKMPGEIRAAGSGVNDLIDSGVGKAIFSPQASLVALTVGNNPIEQSRRTWQDHTSA